MWTFGHRRGDDVQEVELGSKYLDLDTDELTTGKEELLVSSEEPLYPLIHLFFFFLLFLFLLNKHTINYKHRSHGRRKSHSPRMYIEGTKCNIRMDDAPFNIVDKVTSSASPGRLACLSSQSFCCIPTSRLGSSRFRGSPF